MFGKITLSVKCQGIVSEFHSQLSADSLIVQRYFKVDDQHKMQLNCHRGKYCQINIYLGSVKEFDSQFSLDSLFYFMYYNGFNFFVLCLPLQIKETKRILFSICLFCDWILPNRNTYCTILYFLKQLKYAIICEIWTNVYSIISYIRNLMDVFKGFLTSSITISILRLKSIEKN